MTGEDAPSGVREAVRREGFAVVPDAVDAETLSSLERALEAAGGGGVARRRGVVYAVRNLLEIVPSVREFCRSPAALSLVAPVLGESFFPVRGLLFDKTPAAPWKVAWHQDLSIAVRERKDAEGFGPWSEKVGVVHVQPPARVLEGMLSLRLHLDECDETNGPLRVIPGSHLFGRLGEEEIRRWRRDCAAVTCAVPRGGALLMRPLLLHSSPTPQRPGRRRVIHLEFAAQPLPGGLEWRG